MAHTDAITAATWGTHLFNIAVYVFLAMYTIWGPRHRGKPLRVDVLIAPLAGPKAALLYTAEGRLGVSKVVKFSVEVANRECAL